MWATAQEHCINRYKMEFECSEWREERYLIIHKVKSLRMFRPILPEDVIRLVGTFISTKPKPKPKPSYPYKPNFNHPVKEFMWFNKHI